MPLNLQIIAYLELNFSFSLNFTLHTEARSEKLLMEHDYYDCQIATSFHDLKGYVESNFYRLNPFLPL
jgi:hypothetical protein